MNDKMGGDLTKIGIVGEYLIEVWKAAGMDLDNVEFRWASKEITENAHVYWPLMLDVARRFNITRIKKCCQIMGRLEGSLTSAQVLYPLMQCTDVFFLKADICQLGVDQRKVNMLAREYCDAAKKKFKPVILSHHMLYGLKKGQEKMSKSDPDSAVFMEDTVEDVERKINKGKQSMVSLCLIIGRDQSHLNFVSSAYCPTMADIEGEEGGDINAADTEEDAGKESMHLTKDTLKNPILDYVQHIVLSPPGSSFTCGTSSSPDGQTFTKYEDVKASFIKGDITPEQLKKGLINSLNQLLQPVRDHFTNDDNARQLLEQVREFKRTAAPSTDDDMPKVVRNDLVSSGTVPANSHLVMTSLPSSNPSLQSAADLLVKLSASPEKGSPKVLMLMDWTARVNGALDADAKLLSAYYSVLLTSLRALDKQLNGEENAVMNDVTVLLQSEAILKDPSNYWISVINAGRHFSLDTVMGAGIGLGEGMKDSEQVGVVIGRLMMVADVLAVNPKSIALDPAVDEMGSALAGLNIEESADGSPSALSVEAHLIQEYYKAKLSHPAITSQYPVPAVVHTSDGPNLQLQPPRESAALKTEFDEYFLLDDPKVNAKSKTKKSFCEPGNVDFCPPIELLAYFGGLDSGKEVTIQRSPDNGGDVTYTSKADLRKDFESGALHPGDLKGLVSSTMLAVLTSISDELKKSDEAVKGAKALKAFEKKMAKQKKK